MTIGTHAYLLMSITSPFNFTHGKHGFTQRAQAKVPVSIDLSETLQFELEPILEKRGISIAASAAVFSLRAAAGRRPLE
jgi:hypothetical protein